ncbi:endo-1,4-beta-xylanase precursor [Sistotremastrum niveocremeum HHB9708]|uniref:Beta-xylanase n=2 Tax=Sistotremastraceae TaxID=3402574 RepID=A0A164T929_9AGAM|nr:endo-1,4-beta-xylanase precursor [Sistotremastrum niveocremeum HHB9708]KZT35098.1 endo-1,4-beta-xylanase C precursor [Sistotremastrum suecicum HHB10207 ss-3]
MISLGLVALAASLVAAQSTAPQWGQCGGIGWKGPTTCPSGWTCVPQANNPYYSQCLQGSASSSTTSTTSKSTTTTSSSTSTTTSTTTTKSTTTTTSTTSSSSPPSGTGLNVLAKAAGKLYFGSATDNPEFTDAPYLAILGSSEFGQITPGNSMKWDATEPSQNTFSYTGGDAVLSLATSHNQIVRAHNLCWYSQLPNWVSSGSWTAASLTAVLQNHIANVAGHYKGKVYAWDVVNEPFSDSGGMRSMVFQTVIGNNYLNIAFAAARAADPNAKLYLNDYNLEYTGAKFNTAVSTITSLVQQGVPIDAVGFEGHMIVGSVPSASALATQMNTFTALGLDVAFTEIDIRMTLPSTPALLAQQETDYQNMVAACMQVKRCVGVTIWDYTDKYSWVPQTFSGQGAACPWDSNLVKKPAYSGIVAAL